MRKLIRIIKNYYGSDIWGMYVPLFYSS